MTSSTHDRSLVRPPSRVGAGGRFVAATARHRQNPTRRADVRPQPGVDSDVLAHGDAQRGHRLRAPRQCRPRERELIVIAFHERLTYREIAVRLNMPEGTVKSRIRLALLKMRFHLSEYYARPAAAPTGDEHDEHRPSNAE